MKKKNVVLFDNEKNEASEYMQGLINSTGVEWHSHFVKANQERKNIFCNIKRYIKYFTCPFHILLNRKKYETIIAWQAFYGIIFAFYCRLFHLKKQNKLIIQNFIYKPKKGLIGKIYFKFLNYSIKGGYINLIITCTKNYVNVIKDTFCLEAHQVAFLPLGVNDLTLWVDNRELPEKDYILSVGRSNRDYDFFINALTDYECETIICCDELHNKQYNNIVIKNDVHGAEAYKYMQNCKCAVIPIKDASIPSGETVILQQMCFGKPVIITSGISADTYIQNGINGLIVNKNKEELINAVNKIFNDKDFYDNISKNARKDFLEKYSLYSHGVNVGKLLLEISII